MHAAVVPFTVAAVLIVLLPGPDTLVVVRNILFGGRRQGALTALGNVCGLAHLGWRGHVRSRRGVAR